MLADGWGELVCEVLRKGFFSAAAIVKAAARADLLRSVSDDVGLLVLSEIEAGRLASSWHGATIISLIAAGDTKSVRPTREICNLPRLASARKLSGVMAPPKKRWHAASSVMNGSSSIASADLIPAMAATPSSPAQTTGQKTRR